MRRPLLVCLTLLSATAAAARGDQAVLAATVGGALIAAPAVIGLSPVDDLLRVRATPNGSPPENVDVQLSGDGVPANCVNGGGSLCLVGDRFQVQSVFLTSAALEGGADTVRLTDETGYLYFFSPSNVEAVVKVLNACPVNNRYWVFAGGLTNVRTLITVTDTLRNSTKIYVNPQGSPFQPIQDTSAFATCP
jgi:hypothetical protein